MARALTAVAAIESVELAPERREYLAESLPGWRAFNEVPGALAELRERGWKLAILSNTDPDLLTSSVQTLGVPFELSITAAEAGSYKPAPGHWNASASSQATSTRTCTSPPASFTTSRRPPRWACRRCGSTASARRRICRARPSCPTSRASPTPSPKPLAKRP